MRYAGLLTLLILLSSCTIQYIEPGSAEPGYPMAVLEDKEISLIVSSEVDVRKFRRTFAKRFGSGKAFAEELADKIEMTSWTIRPLLISSITAIPEEAEKRKPEQEAVQPDSSSQAKEIQGEHCLKIENIVISNDVAFYPGMTIPLGGGGMPAVSSQEFCFVSYDAKIIRNVDNKAVCSFRVIGKSGVGLYYYERALMEAMQKSVNHLVHYIGEGKTKYENYE